MNINYNISGSRVCNKYSFCLRYVYTRIVSKDQNQLEIKTCINLITHHHYHYRRGRRHHDDSKLHNQLTLNSIRIKVFFNNISYLKGVIIKYYKVNSHVDSGFYYE